MKVFNQKTGAKYLGISKQTFVSLVKRGLIKQCEADFKVYSKAELDSLDISKSEKGLVRVKKKNQ